jgi:ferredoxin
MRIEVDRDKCISITSCIAIAPDVFELDEDGKARVKDPTGADQASILAAAQSCPVDAITIFDDDGVQIHPPVK